MRYKRGHTRQDGMMFWSYRYNNEIWLTPENFKIRHQKKLVWQRKNVDPIQNRKNVMEWTKNNLSSKLARVRKYQAMKRNSKVLCGDTNVIKVFYDAAKRVGKCVGIKFHVDHIVPLSLGGSHHQKNLQWVPYMWNLSKHNRESGKIFSL
jgi:5-methylcytosine-specific restriction endonuclease McrA